LYLLEVFFNLNFRLYLFGILFNFNLWLTAQQGNDHQCSYGEFGKSWPFDKTKLNLYGINKNDRVLIIRKNKLDFYGQIRQFEA
jgi:hypothetical protein